MTVSPSGKRGCLAYTRLLTEGGVAGLQEAAQGRPLRPVEMLFLSLGGHHARLRDRVTRKADVAAEFLLRARRPSGRSRPPSGAF